MDKFDRMADTLAAHGYLSNPEDRDRVALCLRAGYSEPPDSAKGEADERRVRCNHCMSVFDEEYIDIDAQGPDTGETCPCCGKGDALMDMSL